MSSVIEATHQLPLLQARLARNWNSRMWKASTRKKALRGVEKGRLLMFTMEIAAQEHRGCWPFLTLVRSKCQQQEVTSTLNQIQQQHIWPHLDPLAGMPMSGSQPTFAQYLRKNVHNVHYRHTGRS